MARSDRSSPRRGFAFRVAAILLSTAVALGLAELGLRLWQPHGTFRSAYELPWMHEIDSVQRTFDVDPEMGFAPVVPSHAYDEHGLYRKRTDACEPDARRILFVGDSVTAGGKIQAGLRNCDSLTDACFLTAGVGSFNTVQELAFFRRHNLAADPDHVVLLFHLNDFESTPVVFRDDDGRLRVYATFLESRRVWAWGYAHSFLYRLLLGLTVDREDATERIAEETLAAVDGFAETTAAAGIGFTVVVLPIFRPRAEWAPRHAERYERIRDHLEATGTPFVDLVDSLSDSTTRPMGAAGGRDLFHPSDAFARELAAILCDSDPIRPGS